MNEHAQVTTGTTFKGLIKGDPTVPALLVTGPTAIAIRAGTTFGGRRFDVDTPVIIEHDLAPGCDYAIVVVDGDVGYAALQKAPTDYSDILGGFHFAPGGNATARSGGDSTPAINPYSVWDTAFRPACPDPRGMALVEGPAGRFWCDIYLLGIDHLTFGTSKLGVTIADGDSVPQNPAGPDFDGLDYATTVAVMKHHGKSVPSVYEFFAAAYGVTEKSACGDEPEKTQLDAARTSKWGIIQATGNMWVWGHDGDPDSPRPSVFGGSWVGGSGAGSRFAVLGGWPEASGGNLGARGRSDHLQLG